MSKFHLIFTVVLLLQASSAWCSDDGDNADLKVARKIPSSNSYYSNYNPYSAWRPWNVPYYQQYYQPSARIPRIFLFYLLNFNTIYN